MFTTPGPLDFVAVAPHHAAVLGTRACLLASRGQEPRRAPLLLPRRPDHREQPDGHPPRVGTHVQGRRPALPGAVRLRATIPERLRLPGPVGGGRGREDAGIQLEAGDRVVRPRALLARLPRTGAPLRAVQTEQSKRLGQWMDWPSSYFTMSDANIEYNWSFLQRCHERGWLYTGHRPMPWCTRCGTSISQHEMLDAYAELTHESVTVALPLPDRPDHRLLVWTTTPWTLPANVAVAVHPAARLRRVRAWRTRSTTSPPASPAATRRSARRGAPSRAPSSWGCATSAPSTTCPSSGASSTA